MKHETIKNWILVFSLSLLFSFFQSFLHPSIIICIFSFIIYSLLWGLLIIKKPRFSRANHTSSLEKYFFYTLSNKQFFLCLWGILILCWLPAFLAYYPGIFGYDAPYQLENIMEGTLSDHHPLLHTWLLQLFLNTGVLLSSKYTLGVTLMCLFQVLCVTACIAHSFLLFKRKSLPFWLTVIVFLWCVFNPVLQTISMNITKDVLFGCVFFELVLQIYNYLDSNRSTSRFPIFIFGLLTALLRNQGKYILLALLLLMCLSIKKTYKLLLPFICALIISQVFFAATWQIPGLERGNKKEMLSVPMQQIAVLCRDYQNGDTDVISKEEFDKFSLLFTSSDAFNVIEAESADPVKAYFNTPMFTAFPGEYTLLYIKAGLKNPASFYNTWKSLIAPYWFTSLAKYKGLTYISLENSYTVSLDIKRHSLFPLYQSLLQHYIEYFYQLTDDNVTLILQPVLCVWLIFALTLIGLRKKDTAVIYSGLACLLLFGTIILGPVALLRYIFPLTIMTPWLVGLLYTTIQK